MADVTMVKRVSEAIRNAVTRIDGDPVGVHLSYSIALDESNADETMAGIKSICEDAARAAIAAMREPTEAMEDAADDPFHAAWKSDREIFERWEQWRVAQGMPRRVPEGKQAHGSCHFTRAMWPAMIDAALAEGEGG